METQLEFTPRLGALTRDLFRSLLRTSLTHQENCNKCTAGSWSQTLYGSESQDLHMTPAGGCPKESSWCVLWGRDLRAPCVCVWRTDVCSLDTFGSCIFLVRAASHSEETVDKGTADLLPMRIAVPVNGWPCGLGFSKKSVTSPNSQAKIVDKWKKEKERKKEKGREELLLDVVEKNYYG